MIYLPAILSGPDDLITRDRPGAACAPKWAMASTDSHNSLHVNDFSNMLSHYPCTEQCRSGSNFQATYGLRPVK